MLLSALATLILHGQIFEQKSNHQKLLYDFQKKIDSKPTGKKTENKFLFPKTDKLAATEEGTFDTNGNIKTYTLRELQAEETGTVTVSGKENKKIEFRFEKKGTPPVMNSEFLTGRTILPDQVPREILANWNFLMEGKELEFRLAVVTRAETVGFKVFKDSQTVYDGKAAIVFKLKPIIFTYSLLVEPIYFTFELLGSHRLREVDGRMSVKKFSEKSKTWEDLDAVLVLEAY